MAPRKTKATRKPKATKPKSTRPKRKAPKRKNILSSLGIRRLTLSQLGPFNRTMLPNVSRALERRRPQGRRLQFIGKG